MDLADYLPSDWVGAVFIASDQPMAAIAERRHAQDGYALANRARSAGSAGTQQFGAFLPSPVTTWSSRISIADMSGSDNAVQVTLIDQNGSIAGTELVTVPANGMSTLVIPGSGDFDAAFNWNVVITGAGAFHAAIDAIHPTVAGTYAVEGDAAGDGDRLFAPVVRRGDPSTGLGASSSIVLANTSETDVVQVAVTFFDQLGQLAAPTQQSPFLVTMSPMTSIVLHTMSFAEMAAGFQGSAMVEVEGEGSITGVVLETTYAEGASEAFIYNLVKVEP